MRRLATLVGFLMVATAAVLTPTGRIAEAQPVCFQQTGFCVDNPAFLGYFYARGATDAFGFPISREFTFLGFRVQFFQGHIMQIMPNGSVATMNLLDEGLMPVTRVNGSTFPASDPGLVDATPRTGERNYDGRIIEFIRQNAPNRFNGQPVGFFDKFIATVRLETAFPGGGGNPALVPLLNLEIWGAVTSYPLVEPTNPGFIYQRFQRSIMHYRESCRCTERILLADWFKTVFTGQGLPGDLADDMARSPYIHQWRPGATRSLARPDELPTTDLTDAFVPDLPGFSTPPPAPDVAGTPPTATATPAPGGGPDLTLGLSDDRVNQGETFTITLEATSDKGVDSTWWWATDTDDDNLRNTHTFDCNGANPCRNTWDASTSDTGRIVIHGSARDRTGAQAAEATADLRVRVPTNTATPTSSTTMTPGPTATATASTTATPTQSPTPTPGG